MTNPKDVTQPNPLEFAKAAQIFWPAMDQARRALGTQPEPKDQTCHKGCGACCHNAVISCSSLEAFCVVVAWVGQGKDLAQLATQCQSYVTGYRMVQAELGHMPFTLASRQRFMKRRLACPLFVRESGAFGGHCGFFEDRPLICSFYHSLDDPLRCAAVAPHNADSARMTFGESKAHELRELERRTCGKSALGHLPLLMAALLTQDGLNAFLRCDGPVSEDPEAQGERDFAFLLELYQAAGLEVTATDLQELLEAQAEASPS
jgi:hypothetical protein